MTTTGVRIKEKRKELGLSVEQVAEMLGKNRATVYRYENDDIENLPLAIIRPLAQILKTTPSYLMGWDQIKEVFDSSLLEGENKDNLSAKMNTILSENRSLKEENEKLRKLLKDIGEHACYIKDAIEKMVDR